jgi:uncharacterized lipoprotein NlpE involved in copper resistance
MSQKIFALSILTASLLGCSNTVPEVGFIVDPSLLRTSDKTFVQSDVAAATTVTATGYTGTIMVHAGNNGTRASSTDNSYQLTIRKITY